MLLVSYGFIGSTHPWVDITTMFFFGIVCRNRLYIYMGVSKNRGIMENPIKMDDLGVPLFLETPIY